MTREANRLSETLKLKCPCGSIMAVAAKFVGRRAACNGCGKKFTIPQVLKKSSARSKTKKANTKKAKTMGLADTGIAKGAKSNVAMEHPCPSCHKNMGQGMIVCVLCGYHTKLKKKLKTFGSDELAQTESEFESSKSLISLLLWPTALIFVVAASFWARTVQGPTFLVFFFVSFCLFGCGVLFGRKLFSETDVFNYTAAGTLAGVGIIRIVDSIMEERFKFMFLVVGIIVSVGVFLLTTTEQEKQEESPFIGKNSELSLIAYLALLLPAIGILASIFFIPAVGQVVVRLGWIVVAAFGFIFGGFWGVLNLKEFGGGRGGSGFCSSGFGSGCSSSCGGGGCGGGCGGCGG